jgi:adenylate cyclase
MSDVFISYARANEPVARMLADTLRAEGYQVWRDDALPAHRPFADVIRERLEASRAVVVIWSEAAAKSHWVQSEADYARTHSKLVQVRIDGSALPMPFDRIQCEALEDWPGAQDSLPFRKLLASIAELVPSRDGAPPSAPSFGAGPTHSPERAALPLPSKPSIAVLPLANLSGDPEQEYFADGMAIELIEALSRFREIFVIDSSSTRALKGRNLSPKEASRELGVRYVLEGHVRKAGGRVRVGIQLVDAIEGSIVLSQRFEDVIADVFDLQDKVALAVAGRIEPTINAEEIKRAAGRTTKDTDSYDLYLRAYAISQSHTREATLEGLDLLERALALDPDFGLALVRAAHCHRLIHIFRWADDPDAHREMCLARARRALQVAGDDATVLNTVAFHLTTVAKDDKTALALIDRAIAINPGHARMFYWSARLLLAMGDTQRAVEHLERSMRLDPIGPLQNVRIFGLGLAHFAEGQFEEALARFRESGLYPGSSFANAFMAACLAHLGQRQAAAEAARAFRARGGLSLEELGGTWLHKPAHLALLLDGMRLAEGREPASASG